MNGPSRAPSSPQSAPQASVRPHGHRTPERGSGGRTGVRDLTQWAVTAAACTTVVCATGWPTPTLYALTAVTGAALAIAGLRALGRRH